MTADLDKFRDFMDQGHSAAWDQKWDQAAAFYREALKVTEDSPQALTSLGLALFELGQHREALQCYQRSAQLEPTNPLPFEKIGQLCELDKNIKVAVRAYLRAADLYIKDKDARKAIENWERIVQLDPNNLTANMRLGMINEKLGNQPMAVKAFLASATGLQSAGKPEKARQMIEQALKIMPNNQEAIHFLALLADYKPLPKETKPIGAPAPKAALQGLQHKSPSAEQLAADPIQEAAARAVAELAGLVFETEHPNLFHKGQRDFQALVTGTSEKKTQTPDLSGVRQHIFQSIDFQKKERFYEAANELQRAVDTGLDHPAAFFDLGFLYQQSGSLEKAAQNLQKAVKNEDFALGAHLLFGNLLRENQQMREAALEYLHALKLADIAISPEDQKSDLQQWYELLIETNFQKQDTEMQTRICENIPSMLARPDWRKALQRVRQQMPGYQEGGGIIPLGEMVSLVESSEIIESISLINELSARGLYQSAMEEALHALQYAPSYLPLHALIGDLLERNGDRDSAVAKFQIISRTYEVRGDLSQSIAYTRRIVELTPGDLDERGKLVDQLIASGEMGDAIEEIAQLAEFHYALADLESSREAYMRAYNTALRTGGDPQLKVRLLQQIADIDLQSMEWRRAIGIFEQIRLIQPDLEKARDQIIRLNLRLGQETQALVELDHYANHLTGSQRNSELALFMEGLLGDYPENIPLKRRLVDVYRITGQVSEAVNQLDSIGEILLQKGDRSGAIQTIETIISLGPPKRAEYQNLLEQLRSKIEP